MQSVLFLWSPYGIEQTIIFSCCSLFFLLLSSSFSFFPRLISAAADWMSAILPHVVWPLCEFKMQVWNLLHAARWKHRTQKVAKGTTAQLCQATGYIFATKARIDNRKENLLSSNMSSTCPHDMVNFGLLAAKISLPVWGPCKFQRVSRLGSVTARQSSSERQPDFAALNRGRHLCSAGRPSRWSLAHISSNYCFRVQ